ncbi:hypothetical protein ACEPAF_7545 [Sanghuangporus sanghuang]
MLPTVCRELRFFVLSAFILDFCPAIFILHGSLLLALNNAVNSVARVVMGYLADRVGRQNTLIVSVLLSSVSVFALWYDTPQARFITFVVLYGVLAGGYNALLPTTLTAVYGVQNYDVVNGSIYFSRISRLAEQWYHPAQTLDLR